MGAYWGYRLAQELSGILTPRAAFRCAEWYADLSFRRAAREREAVCANLSLLLGGSPSRHAMKAREVFRHFARYVVEWLNIHRVIDPAVTIEGREHLRQAQQGGRGAIVLTAHVGNWELGAVMLRRMGFPVSAVALPHADPRMNRLLDRQRMRCGIQVIPVGREAARLSLQCLRDGHLLGLLGDRHTVDEADEGLIMPIGGGRMALPRGPAVLSVRSGAAILPAVLIREGPWRFHLRCEAPLWPEPAEPTEQAVHRLIASFATSLESWLKRFSEQWVVFQPVLSA